jgi:hypothetical protein
MLNTFSFDLCINGKILVYRRAPENFWKSQTRPPDTSLLLLPLAPPLPSLCSALPPPLTAGTEPRAPPQAATRAQVSPRALPPLFPSLPGLARAPRRPRAIAGRHLLVVVDSSLPRLNLLPLARSSTTSTHTCYSTTPSNQFRASEPHFPAAVLLRSGRAQHARGQPSPAHLRPNQHLHKLPCYLLVLDDQLFSSNFHWNFISDEAPPPPPSASPWAARSEPLHATTIP